MKNIYLLRRVYASQIYILFYILESLIVLKIKKFLRSSLRKLLKIILNPLFKIKNKNSNLEKAYANTVYILIKKKCSIKKYLKENTEKF